MANKSTKNQQVKLLFKYDPNYSMIYPSDAYGGMNPKGKLVMNLFTDMHTPPIAEKHKLNEDSRIDPSTPPTQVYLDPEIEEEKDSIYYDRIIHNTVVLAPDDAINIGLWMISTVINDPNFQYDKIKLKNHFLKMINISEDKTND